MTISMPDSAAGPVAVIIADKRILTCLFVPTRVVFFYFDPAKMRTPGEMGAAGTVLSARLFFEANSLWETALKLARLNAGVRRREAPVRGQARTLGYPGWTGGPV